jgi:hypothetical protein
MGYTHKKKDRFCTEVEQIDNKLELMIDKKQSRSYRRFIY